MNSSNTLVIGFVAIAMFLLLSSYPLVYGDQTSQSLKVLSSSKFIDATGALNVVGEVQNTNTTKTFNSVQVFATFYDSSGKVVGESGTDTHPTDLNPGMKGPFSIYLDNTMSSIPLKNIANYTLVITHQ